MERTGKEYALSLGFSEDDAERIARVGASNENIDRMAVAKGLVVDEVAEARKAAATEAAAKSLEEAAAAEYGDKCPICSVTHNPASNIARNHAKLVRQQREDEAALIAEAAIASAEDSDGSEGGSETETVPATE